MNEKIDLKEIEQKSFKSTYEDGLFDILLGVISLNFGINILITDLLLLEYYIGYISMLIIFSVGFTLFYLGKKYITVPRTGFVKFSPARNVNLMKSVIILSISVLLGFIIFLLAALNVLSPDLERPIFATMFLMNCIVIFGLMAHYLGIKRMYLYGVLLGLPIFIAILSNALYFIIPVSIISPSIMIGIGITILIRFKSKYPISDGDSINDKL